MPKAKPPKNLVVDGTAKLAAKSKPSDKHEAPDLNIEEATVASPRPSRKRAGDYFDFDNGADAEPSSKSTELKVTKSNKKKKTAPAGKDGKSDKVEDKPVAKAKRGKKGEGSNGKGPKDEVAESPSEAIAQTEDKEKRSRKPKVAKNDDAEEKPVSSQRSKKATKELAANEFKTTKAETKESKASKTQSAADTAVDATDAVRKEPKAKTAKAKKSTKTDTPATETAGNVAHVVTKVAKAGTKKAKQAAESMASVAETPAGVADVVNDAKAGSEKLKAKAKSKNSKPAKDEDSVKLTGLTEEKSKPEASKSKKRKAPPSADTEMVKTDILDPLSEHASAKKKLKKANSKSKSLVGELLATATEGANAAKASLGGLATSIMGGASEATQGVTDAKKSTKASAKKAKGKGKAIAEDVAESSVNTVATDGPGDASPEDDSDDEPDDQTTALLAGFESDGDEGPDPGSGFEEGQKIPRLPKAETTTKKLEDVKNGADEGPGVVYLGRIPHGFYEHEIRQYFSQFGVISRLRLSRSQKSGASRHYAFVEFTSAGVAKIVADTMDNYLMFGHILRCKMVAKEQIHESLWKGANKRFKAVPWNKIEGRKLEMGITRGQWAGRVEGEEKRRASKNEKTKEIGYEFEAGELKGVDEVPVRDAITKMENGEKVEEEKSLVTAGGEGGNGPIVVSEEVRTKRVKKVKGKTEETTTTIAKKTKRALDAGEEVVGSAAKRAKKGKNAAA